MVQAALSRGVQHSSALVRYATLCALRQMLDALHLALTSASKAADCVDQSPSSPAPQRPQPPSQADVDIQAHPSSPVVAHAAAMKDPEDLTMGGETMDVDEVEPPAAGSGHPGEESAVVAGHATPSSADVEDVELPVHDNLQKAPGQAQRSGPKGNAWRGFVGQLRSAARGRLPDLQPLLALLATLHAEIHAPDKLPPMEVCHPSSSSMQHPFLALNCIF